MRPNWRTNRRPSKRQQKRRERDQESERKRKSRDDRRDGKKEKKIPKDQKKRTGNGVLRKLKHIFPNTYQRIKSIRSPAKGGNGCYRFNYQPGS